MGDYNLKFWGMDRDAFQQHDRYKQTRGPLGFARGKLFDSGVRPFDCAQGRLSLRMTPV
jgi:hypothetical protein